MTGSIFGYALPKLGNGIVTGGKFSMKLTSILGTKVVLPVMGSIAGGTKGFITSGYYNLMLEPSNVISSATKTPKQKANMLVKHAKRAEETKLTLQDQARAIKKQEITNRSKSLRYKCAKTIYVLRCEGKINFGTNLRDRSYSGSWNKHRHRSLSMNACQIRSSSIAPR